MSGPDLDPHVQALLDDVVDEMDLDPEVVGKLLDRAKHLEGAELEEAVFHTLRRA